jgi:nucleotidyltransferase/DNA polymerase involved in DNA repair
MTFVALSIPGWPTGAASNDLLAQLLAVAPRAAIAPGEQLAWLDARGLDPVALTARARAALAEIGVTEVFAGAARVPCVAAIAAKERNSRLSVPAGTERAWLAPLPLDVLAPADKLMSLFAGVGLETCGDLARLSRESVEVRFGREGLLLWKLARADDPRPIFSSRPRELPNASLDWTEFSTTDLEQLVFVLHSLLKTVCDAIAIDGVGARSLTLTLALENRTTITHAVGAARATAQRTTWLRLMRRALERITLPDRVTGIAIQVDMVGAPAVRQGDLFDLGFASAHAAESAVAHVMDLQHDAVVRLERGGHPLMERRVRWIAKESHGPEAVSPRPNALSLNPMLLPSPREVTVLATSRRGFTIPIRYVDNDVPYPLKECLGPHCISGDRWTERVAREYHQGIRADGTVVLLYHDVLSDQWYLAGWWD